MKKRTNLLTWEDQRTNLFSSEELSLRNRIIFLFFKLFFLGLMWLRSEYTQRILQALTALQWANRIRTSYQEKCGRLQSKPSPPTTVLLTKFTKRQVQRVAISTNSRQTRIYTQSPESGPHVGWLVGRCEQGLALMFVSRGYYFTRSTCTSLVAVSTVFSESRLTFKQISNHSILVFELF